MRRVQENITNFSALLKEWWWSLHLWVGRVGIISKSLHLELLLMARRRPLMLRTVPTSWESRILPNKDSRYLLCALVEKEDLRVSWLRKILLEKCNVAPILSWRLTQQEGNIFTSTYRFTSPSPSQHHNIIITISPSQYHYNNITITISPSPSQYHNMAVNQKSPPPQPS